MKFLPATVATTLLLLQLVTATPAAAVTDTAPSHNIPSMTEALQAAKDAVLPEGVTLTGTVEQLKQHPATTTTKKTESTAAAAAAGAATTNTVDEAHMDAALKHQEWFGGHPWGGWGGFGPYRFGFSCGGLGGWAYPLGYWNTFGAGLYGGACGLGLACGGLYYC